MLPKSRGPLVKMAQMASMAKRARQGPQVIVDCREQLQIPARQAAQEQVVGRVRRARQGLQEIPQPSPDRVARREGQVRRVRQGLQAQPAKKAMPASRTLESVAPRDIQARRVILEHHQMSRGRRGTQDGLVHQDPQAIPARTAITVKRVRQAPQVIKEILDQINLPPSPLRLRALLPHLSLFSLRKLRRLLLLRLHLLLRVLRNRQVGPLAPQVNLVVREAKETLETLDPTAQPEILVLADALARQVIQALLDQADPLE